MVAKKCWIKCSWTLGTF